MHPGQDTLTYASVRCEQRDTCAHRARGGGGREGGRVVRWGVRWRWWGGWGGWKCMGWGVGVEVGIARVGVRWGGGEVGVGEEGGGGWKCMGWGVWGGGGGGYSEGGSAVRWGWGGGGWGGWEWMEVHGLGGGWRVRGEGWSLESSSILM